MNTESMYRKEAMKTKYVEVLIFNSKEDIQRYYKEGEEDGLVSRRVLEKDVFNEALEKNLTRTMTKGQVMMINPMK